LTASASRCSRRSQTRTSISSTAREISAKEREELLHRLERSSGKKIRATFAVDETLLGGAKVQVGDRLIDSSLKAQLDELRRELAS
jgi:F-type H+-transporting ATPase subunit delta